MEQHDKMEVDEGKTKVINRSRALSDAREKEYENSAGSVFAGRGWGTFWATNIL